MSIRTKGVLWALVAFAVCIAAYFAVSGENTALLEASKASGQDTPQSTENDDQQGTAFGGYDSSVKEATLDERYERSEDLYGLTLELNRLSESGNGEASRLIASAYEECWLFAINPVGFEQDMKLRAKASPELTRTIRKVVDSTTNRCRGFAGASIGPKAISSMLRKAAEQGDLAAQVKLLGVEMAMGSNFDANSQKELAQRVAMSKDPSAYAAIASLMGPLSNGRQDALAPLPAGSVTSEAAWQIAACRLGQNCGPESSKVAQMCIAGGVNCRLRGLEQFYLQELLPPAEQEKLWQQVNILTQGNWKP